MNVSVVFDRLGAVLAPHFHGARRITGLCLLYADAETLMAVHPCQETIILIVAKSFRHWTAAFAAFKKKMIEDEMVDVANALAFDGIDILRPKMMRDFLFQTTNNTEDIYKELIAFLVSQYKHDTEIYVPLQFSWRALEQDLPEYRARMLRQAATQGDEVLFSQMMYALVRQNKASELREGFLWAIEEKNEWAIARFVRHVVVPNIISRIKLQYSQEHLLNERLGIVKKYLVQNQCKTDEERDTYEGDNGEEIFCADLFIHPRAQLPMGDRQRVISNYQMVTLRQAAEDGIEDLFRHAVFVFSTLKKDVQLKGVFRGFIVRKHEKAIALFVKYVVTTRIIDAVTFHQPKSEKEESYFIEREALIAKHVALNQFAIGARLRFCINGVFCSTLHFRDTS